MCSSCGCKSAETGKKNCGCGQDPCKTYGADENHTNKDYKNMQKDLNKFVNTFCKCKHSKGAPSALNIYTSCGYCGKEIGEVSFYGLTKDAETFEASGCVGCQMQKPVSKEERAAIQKQVDKFNEQLALDPDDDFERYILIDLDDETLIEDAFFSRQGAWKPLTEAFRKRWGKRSELMDKISLAQLGEKSDWSIYSFEKPFWFEFECDPQDTATAEDPEGYGLGFEFDMTKEEAIEKARQTHKETKGAITMYNNARKKSGGGSTRIHPKFWATPEMMEEQKEYYKREDMEWPTGEWLDTAGKFNAETYEAQGKPTWAGYCPFCKKWRTTEWSKKYGGDTVCAKGIPDPHYNSGDEALFVRENFARKGGKWIRPKENICGVVLEKKQSKNAETFEARTTRKGGKFNPNKNVRDGAYIYTHKKDGIPMNHDNQKVRKLNKNLRQRGVPLKTKTKNAETFGAERHRIHSDLIITKQQQNRNSVGSSVYIETKCPTCGAKGEGSQSMKNAETFEAKVYDPMMQKKIEQNECTHKFGDGEDAWLLQYSDIDRNEFSYVYATVKCEICGQERYGSWGINEREGFEIVKGEEGRMPKFYGFYAAESHRDSKGRFAEKPVLTGSVIGGLALGLMYFMGRK